MNEHMRKADRPGDGNDDVRAALDREARSVQARHGDRLDAARRAALAARSTAHEFEVMDGSTRHRSGRFWTASVTAMAASVTVAVLVSLILVQDPQEPQSMPGTLPTSSDLELLASEEYDLLADELEFYAWLATQDRTAKEQSG